MDYRAGYRIRSRSFAVACTVSVRAAPTVVKDALIVINVVLTVIGNALNAGFCDLLVEGWQLGSDCNF